MGLVATVVEKDDMVLPAALALARKIAKQSSVAVRSTVRTLRSAQDTGVERSLWREGMEDFPSPSPSPSPPPSSPHHLALTLPSP